MRKAMISARSRSRAWRPVPRLISGPMRKPTPISTTCAQLAGTWQEDADKLMVWFSGRYEGRREPPAASR